MIIEIPLSIQQQAHLSERPTVCVFCHQPVSPEDHKKKDVMLHRVGNDYTRLCHITCVTAAHEDLPF